MINNLQLDELKKKKFLILNNPFLESSKKIYQIVSESPFEKYFLDSKKLKKNYFINLLDHLDEKKKNEIDEIITKTYINYFKNFFKSYIKFQKLINFEITLHKKIDHDDSQPKESLLWHRDADDFLPQIKIFIPLLDQSTKNGCTSVMPSNILKINKNFRDKNLDKMSEDYKYGRISNEYMNDNFKENIYNFECNAHEKMLICDTNNCYHKGGETESGYRMNLFFVYGSPTNRFYIKKTFLDKLQILILRIYGKFFRYND